ncbi:uncharacterized protein NECHADRAFT_81081 [Fusarium vanettenii 77-13-4]|uniref:Uncharacterized protein n=1 Tax=Fusarium vanettenii (strain ATCC MYA-4622 / CBS 123669 / FGSC 9596 / NRRL 45880 / 77-13-4) TaxID=660122 RepID=C7ZGG5_FUSV7|nr:uncharacterized protein NECHADRAFT_81081 [Fusarium vanettenii 77-13-4]EEU36931.1 predicted protein [Fusarium vanettenii 77-13-4]
MLGKGRLKDEIQRLKDLYGADADEIDRAIIDNCKEIGHTFLDVKMLYDEESRLQMMKIATQDKKDEAQKLEEALGPLPTMVDFACMDPEKGRYPKQPYVETADGEFRMDSEYTRFEPPSKIKMGSSSMTDNWDRYVRAGREWAKWEHTLDDKEKKIWTNSRQQQTRQTNGPYESAWALWTLLKVVCRQKEMMGKSVAITVQKRYRKADLTKWPLNEDGPTTDPDFRQIWEAEGETHGASHTPTKDSDKSKKSTQTKKSEKKKKTGKTDANAHRSTDDHTQFLNDLRNTVAGATAEKWLFQKLVEDNVHLTDVNRILASNVSSIE